MSQDKDNSRLSIPKVDSKFKRLTVDPRSFIAGGNIAGAPGDVKGLHKILDSAKNQIQSTLGGLGGFKRSQTINSGMIKQRAKTQIDDLLDAEEMVKRMK